MLNLQTFLKKIFYILIFLFSTINLKGQVFFIDDSTNYSQFNLSECQVSDTLRLYIRLASGTTNGSIILKDSIHNSLFFSSIVSNSAITGYSGLGTNVLTLLIDSTILSNSTNGFYIKVTVKALCGANQTSSLRNYISIKSNGVSLSKSSIDFLNSIKSPNLVIESVSNINTSSAQIGNQYTRKYRIKNSGNNSFIDTFNYFVNYQSGLSFVSLKVNGLTISPTLSSGNINHKFILKLRDYSNFPGDTILIEEEFIVNQCTPSGSFSEIGFFYGCKNSNQCKTTSISSNVNVNISVPNISAKLLSIKYGCYGSWDTVTVAFINIGGKATNLRLRIDQSYPSETNTNPNGSNISYFDTSSFLFRTRYTSFQKRSFDSIVHYGFSRAFWPQSNPVATTYFRYNELNAGDSIVVTYRQYKAEYNNTLCSYTDNSINTSGTYQNNCGNLSYTYNKTNLFHQGHRYSGKTDYKGPAYLGSNDTGSFEFTTQKGASFSHFNQTQDFMVIKFKLPVSLKFSGNSSEFNISNLTTGYTKNSDSIYYNTSTGDLEVFYRNLPYFYSHTVKPKFFVECGSGGTHNIRVQYLIYRPITNCGFQVLPLSCPDDYPIYIYCSSPCTRGGVVPISSKVERINFGLPDNDNNGVPDVSGNIDKSKVEWDKLAPRDTFKITYKGRILRASQSPNANFSFGYGRIYIPRVGNLISVVGSSIKIWDSSTLSYFTVNNLPFVRNDTSVRSNFLFNFSGNVAGFPSGFYYNQGDSFTFEGLFVFNNNVNESGHADNTISTTHSFYVSHLNNPSNDTARYRCLDLPGNFRVVRVYKGYNGGFVTRPNGCSNVAMYSDYFQSFGDCCSNYAGSMHFPYEYRLFTTLDTIKVRIPYGYTLDSSNIRYVYTSGAGKAASRMIYSLTPINVTGEWYTFLLSPFYTINGGNIIPSTTGSYFQLYNYIKGGCSVPQNDTKTQFTADRWLGRNSWTGISVRGVANNHNRGIINYQVSPKLIISNITSAESEAIDKVVYWDVRVSNLVSNSNALNSWISYRTKNNLIQIDSIKNLSTNTFLAVSNNIFRLNTINSSSFVNLRIYGKFNSCLYDSLKLLTGWGCSGFPSGINNIGTNCIQDSSSLYVKVTSPILNSSLISTPPTSVSLCDTLKYSVLINSVNQISSYLPSFDIILPNGGLGLSIVGNISYRYPFNSSTLNQISATNIGSGIFRVFVGDSNTTIKNKGLRPYNESPNDKILLDFKLITDCNFTSGSRIRVRTNGEQPCGSPSISYIDLNSINITGAPSPKLQISKGNFKDLSQCDSNYNFSFVIQNLELGASSSSDSLVMFLPQGIQYVNNSVSFTYNSLSNSNPIVYNIGNRQRLSWSAYPIAALDSVKFNLQVNSPSNISCESNNEWETIVTSNFTSYCNTSPCDISVQNFYNIDTVNVNKPDVRYINGTGFLELIKDTTINPGGLDSLMIENLIFANFGKKIANQPKLNIYCDMNNNNKYEPGVDISFYRDTMNDINVGGTYAYSKKLYFSNQTTPDTLKIELSQKCNCQNDNVNVNSEYRLQALNFSMIDLFLELNSNQKPVLTWRYNGITPINNFILLKSIDGGNTFIEINKFNIQNPENSLDVFTYIDLMFQKNETAFYQIQAYNFNQLIASSEIKEISSIDKKVFIFPNPTDENTIYIKTITPIKNTSKMCIYDITGKIIIYQDLKEISDKKLFSINIESLSSGMYYFEIENQIYQFLKL